MITMGKEKAINPKTAKAMSSSRRVRERLQLLLGKLFRHDSNELDPSCSQPEVKTGRLGN